ncbi:unnamed protein product [Porites evermanni]|uniref:Uncharacterized protein n=1 Tax=Porites evermanni TaxID=104178 RepID=A0ABN8QDJ1_9CNID|nr:unnamed protein product [Porites evermanni]
MSNLTMKWDSSRKLLLEAVRSCEGLPLPNVCPHCCEGKVLIRLTAPRDFTALPVMERYIHPCVSIAEKGFVNGFFEAIPLTITIGENGLKKDVAPQKGPLKNISLGPYFRNCTAPTISHATFSRSFKEWKFCQFELEGLQGLDWVKCPTCSIFQHSCHVDGNMKLYRYKSSGSQRRPSYYANIFIANKCKVDNHLKAVIWGGRWQDGSAASTGEEVEQINCHM